MTSVENEENNTPNQILQATNNFIKFSRVISDDPGYLVYLDNLIWIFGAFGYGGICTENPYCEKCLVRQNCIFIVEN